MVSTWRTRMQMMRKDLQCSICLRLLKKATSLCCDHHFCNSCIRKSLKGSSTCPVCNFPTSRAEIRAVPHMDSLVIVYKDMKHAARLEAALMGISYPPKKRQKGELFASPTNVGQSRDSATLQEKKSYRNKLYDSPREGSLPTRDIMPTNKRVQVPFDVSIKRELCEGYNEQIRDGVAKYTESCKFMHEPENPDSSTKKSKECLGQVDSKHSLYKVRDASFSKLDLHTNSQNLKQYNSGASEGLSAQLENCCDGGSLEPSFQLNEQNVEEDAAKLQNMTLSETIVQCPLLSDPKGDLDEVVLKVSCYFKDLVSTCNSNVEKKGLDTNNLTQLPSSPEPHYNHLGKGTDAIESPIRESPTPESNDRVIDLDRGIEPISNLKSRKTLWKCKCPSLGDPIQEAFETICDEKSTCLKRVSLTTGKTSHKKLHSSHADLTTQGLDLKQKSSSTKDKKEKDLFELVQVKDPTLHEIHMNMKCKDVSRTIAADVVNEATRVQSAEAPVTASPDSESIARKPTCAFCQSSGDSKLAGAIMQYSDGALVLASVDTRSTALTVHKLCAEWAPEVYFTGDKVHNLTEEISRSLKLRCNKCGKRGAALGCSLNRCSKSFHYPCVKTLRNCRWNVENFTIICPDHKHSRFAQPEDFNANLRSDTNPEQLSSSPAYLQWPPGPYRQWVLSGSVLDSDAKEELASVASYSGATIAKTYTSAVTHVIIGTDKDGAARRSLKFLMGTVEGKWILKVDWLKACLAAGKAVEEEPFEVHGDVHGVVEGPKRGRESIANQAPKLFNGLVFHFADLFEASFKEDLRRLIQTGGGTILEEKPSATNPESRGKLSKKFKQKHKVRVLMVYPAYAYWTEDPEEAQCAVEKVFQDTCSIAKEACQGTVVVPHTWITNSAAGWKLQPF